MTTDDGKRDLNLRTHNLRVTVYGSSPKRSDPSDGVCKRLDACIETARALDYARGNTDATESLLCAFRDVGDGATLGLTGVQLYLDAYNPLDFSVSFRRLQGGINFSTSMGLWSVNT